MENIFKLKHFGQFVNEAVRTKDEAKAFDLIASYLSRKMGETLYPYPFFEMYTKKDEQPASVKDITLTVKSLFVLT